MANNRIDTFGILSQYESTLELWHNIFTVKILEADGVVARDLNPIRPSPPPSAFLKSVKNWDGIKARFFATF